ncbi:unnamed protein product, partial [Phaeothamnion confervicola]
MGRRSSAADCALASVIRIYAPTAKQKGRRHRRPHSVPAKPMATTEEIDRRYALLCATEARNAAEMEAAGDAKYDVDRAIVCPINYLDHVVPLPWNRNIAVETTAQPIRRRQEATTEKGADCDREAPRAWFWGGPSEGSASTPGTHRTKGALIDHGSLSSVCENQTSEGGAPAPLGALWQSAAGGGRHETSLFVAQPSPLHRCDESDPARPLTPARLAAQAALEARAALLAAFNGADALDALLA